MGVPKFYRWISERYPCLSQVVKDYQIPEFDNFYLDMNGIIHACSHPNDDDPTFRITEDKIFNEIFTYLEALFRIIKPAKVMFMAVDGVAPRAKLNQQRGRRFRSAREAQDLIRKAEMKGQIMPSEPRFDSNCITPGTEFMWRLQQHLEFFVNKKLSTDPSWQKVEIILSGQDVPGEGEHKIMDYIRYQKAQPGYNPNTRHCLYGLDADLLMLGLVTHEPHFSLLREEVRFGRQSQKRKTSPDTVTFHLLHLSILREYIEYEFACLKERLPFSFDLERVIDDWVLMGFLVGNDFIPHLPNLHIKQDALPFVYQKYIEVLPTLDGYINDGGTLHMGRFESYLRAVAEFDVEFYDELISGYQWLEGKKRAPRAKKAKSKPHEDLRGSAFLQALAEQDSDSSPCEPPGGDTPLLGENKDSEDSESSEKIKRDLNIPDLESYFAKEDQDVATSFDSDFTQLKARYYQEKLGFTCVDEAVLAEQTKCYVVGVQWVLHYYYSGVPSWSWFYPYHYAPYVSDITNFSDLQIDFELGSPFVPFEQLLGVLPPASKSLLPKTYQGLMVNEDSPLKDFYPVNFETDLNGKQHDWEAVVVIPFIDEEQLLLAMEPLAATLSPLEEQRNAHGYCLVYQHAPEVEGVTFPSPWPERFPSITNCKAHCVKRPKDPYHVAKGALLCGLCLGVKLDVYFPGFPSLKFIQHSASLEKRGVRVFQAASREDNMCLTVLPRSDLPTDVFKLAEQLVGRACYVGWPYLEEAMVWAVSDGRSSFYQESSVEPQGGGRGRGGGAGRAAGRREWIVESVLSEVDSKKWREEVATVTRQHLNRHGVVLRSVDMLVYAQVLQGKRYIMDRQHGRGAVCLHKEWAPLPSPFPCSTLVLDIAAFAPEFRENITSLEELFPPKCQCFIMSTPHYGSLAEVLSVDMAQLRVHVRVKVKPEPELGGIMSNRRLNIRYKPSYVVAEEVHLSPLALSRITGSIQVERGSPDNRKERERVNIGLNWKFSKKNKEVPGYARKMERGWTFSPAAVQLLKAFIEGFPKMFAFISANPKQDKYYESNLFEEKESACSMPAAREWLKQIPSHGLESVDCDSVTLDTPQIAAMEKVVRDMQAHKPKYLKTVKLRVKPAALFKPIGHQGNLIPDPEADYELFDRVVNVSISNAVPFGLQGTVSGILGEMEAQYEIVFDEEFLGGLALRCSPNRAYRLPASCLLNISYGKRLEALKDSRKHQASGASYSSAVQNPYQSQFQRAQSFEQQQRGLHTSAGEDGRYRHGGAGRARSPRDGGKIGETYVQQKPIQIASRPSTHKNSSESAGARVKSSSKPAAASDFSSMMYEMETHSRSSPQSRPTQPPVAQEHGRASHQPTDGFGDAMKALSKISLEAAKPTKEIVKRSHHQEQEESKPAQCAQTKELTPSVAAMFDSFSTNDSEEAEDPSQHDKPAGQQAVSSSPPTRMPDAIQKLMRPPIPGQHAYRSRALLPSPAYYQPRVPIRGPLLPQFPQPMPYGPPPPPDPITMLHQITFNLGKPMPNMSFKETKNGMFIGLAEVGGLKYKGVPCHSPDDAMQSAAAVANANLTPSSSVPPHPLHAAAPYPPPPLAPMHHYRGPPPLQYPPPVMMPPAMDQFYHHPKGPNPPQPFSYPTTQPSFVPLQVQRRQMHKSPVTKPVSGDHPKPEEPKAKRNIAEALNKSLEQESPHVPSEPHAHSENEAPNKTSTVNEQSSEPSNSDEGSTDKQQSQEAKVTAEHISQLINVLGGRVGEVGDNFEEQLMDPVPTSGAEGLSAMAGDTVVQAAIVGALSEQEGGDSAVYQEAVQPSDRGETVDPSSITVVGEIISRPQPQKSAKTNLPSDSRVDVEVHTADDVAACEEENTAPTGALDTGSKHTETVAPQTSKHTPKKPKIQLAASFMHSK